MEFRTPPSDGETDAPPHKLQIIAIVQLTSGLINVLVMTALVTLSLSAAFGSVGTFCGGIVASLGCPLGCLGFFGWACGLWGLALLPIGILEAIAGAVALVNPDNARTLVRAAAIAEMASLLFGGIGSAIAGVAVWSLLKDPAVVGYLDGAP